MKILFVSSEITPFAKTGGLADVSGTLPRALADEGHEVRVVMPRYRVVDKEKFALKPLNRSLATRVGDEIAVVSVLLGKLDARIPAYFIDYEPYFDRDGLYGTPKGDYEDNAERFILFCKATLELIKGLGFQPDIIHCNDWQTALIPVYLKTVYKDDPYFRHTATVFTIHNIAYQGLFPKEVLGLAGLGEEQFSSERLEFYGQVNFLKGSLVYADVLNTVSPTYSKEIQTTAEFGYGLEGVLRKRSEDLFGILNGIDYDEWNPAKDEFIAANYSLTEIENKLRCKRALLEEIGFPVQLETPFLGMVSRLAGQKGLDILAEAIGELMQLNIFFILLGKGEEYYHKVFSQIAERYPRKASVHITFDNRLAHKIYAGCDFFLMPSKYEPCGLGQMISIIYGTAPVVTRTGGLADTIQEFDPETGKGNGFLLEEYSGPALIKAVKKAIQVYTKKELWGKLIRNMMETDFSWTRAVKEYVRLYQKAAEKRMG